MSFPVTVRDDRSQFTAISKSAISGSYYEEIGSSDPSSLQNSTNEKVIFRLKSKELYGQKSY